MSDESCFKMDTVVRREVKKPFYMLLISETQKHSVSIVSIFYFLCLCKTGTFDIIEKSSSMFLRYGLTPRFHIAVVFLHALWIKCYIFVTKHFMLDCRFSLKTYLKNVREKETKGSLKTTVVLLNADGHALT